VVDRRGECAGGLERVLRGLMRRGRALVGSAPFAAWNAKQVTAASPGRVAGADRPR
jgi:hypothetical protein